MLRFRLRTMLIAVSVLCAVFAWVEFSLNWIKQRHDILLRIRIPQMRVGFGPSYAPGGLWLLGEAGVTKMWCDPLTPEDEEELKRLYPEAEIIQVE